MIKWVVTQARLRDVPGGQPGSIILCEMPFGSLVEVVGESTSTYSGMLTPWTEVIYQTSLRTYRGWTYSGFLEDYDPAEHLPVVAIENPTPNPQDAAQNAILFGQTQYNLCGQLCVAYLAGVSLETMLNVWGVKAPTVFNRIFYGGRGRTTGIPDLQSMLTAFDFSTPAQPFQDALRDPVLERTLVTPGRVARLLQERRAIIGVSIEGALGRLKPSGIPHWVVLEQVHPRGINDAVVEIYNPYTNQMEIYSWAELIASMGTYPHGLWVERV